MWMIVGLGNPGAKYAFNRHNIGFLTIDLIHKSYGKPNWKNQDKALVCKVELNGSACLLVKPQTFMNLSGESVVSLMQFYKIPLDHICIIQDDIDQNYGQIKFQTNRGHGGHNGIKSITELTGSNQYIRLKIGVGRPPIPQMDIADWVLQNFSKDEMNSLAKLMQLSVEAIESLIENGISKASSKYNGINALNLK